MDMLQLQELKELLEKSLREWDKRKSKNEQL